MISSGNSIEIASEIVSLLRAHAGAAGGGDAEMAGERGAERHADRGDLVLGLHGADAEVLVLRQFVQDVAGRRDRVRPERDRQLGQLAGGDEAPGERRVAGDAGVLAGRQLGGAHLVAVADLLGGLAEVEPGLERGGVGGGDLLVLRRTWSSIHSSVGSIGRVYMNDTSPRAKKFLERSASRGLTPSGSQASLVSDVIGTLITR